MKNWIPKVPSPLDGLDVEDWSVAVLYRSLDEALLFNCTMDCPNGNAKWQEVHGGTRDLRLLIDLLCSRDFAIHPCEIAPYVRTRPCPQTGNHDPSRN